MGTTTPAPHSFRIADLRVGAPDSANRRVTQIYARKGALFAIYRVEDGDVWVQMADDDAVADAQRVELAKVAKLRWEIDQCADDPSPGRRPAWVTVTLRCLGEWPRPSRERYYHDELAAGLQLVLEKDAAAAAEKLTQLLERLRADRVATGRIQAVQSAFVLGALMFLALGLLAVVFRYWHPAAFAEPKNNIWLAGKAGLVGAYFSIALAIRGRTVAPDNDVASNALDGALRLTIGVIAAGFVLLAFGASGGLSVGTDAVKIGAVTGWQGVVTLGFVAGFLERLVPDLLTKK